jgi:hypothetical protein
LESLRAVAQLVIEERDPESVRDSTGAHCCLMRRQPIQK